MWTSHRTTVINDCRCSMFFNCFLKFHLPEHKIRLFIKWPGEKSNSKHRQTIIAGFNAIDGL